MRTRQRSPGKGIQAVQLQPQAVTIPTDTNPVRYRLRQ